MVVVPPDPPDPEVPVADSGVPDLEVLDLGAMIRMDPLRCVAGIVPAILGAADASWLPEPALQARAIVLFVIDGLGWRAFGDAPGALVNLREFEGGPITTVSPATTAAALTSITTGTLPMQHGLLGFRVRLGEQSVFNVLRWQPEGRGIPAPDPTIVQRHQPFLGQSVPVVAKSEHKGTGFTEAHLRGSRFEGWRAASTIVDHCRRLVAAGERFVYAYYPNVDEVAHEFGLRDGAYAEELVFADDLVGRLRDALPTDCALLVTADHGQVHIEPDAWVELPDDIGALVVAQAGDARCRYLYARDGAQAELLAACRAAFGSRAWVHSRREVMESALMGPAAGGPNPGRIGDVVLMPFEPVGFVDPALPRERGLRSAHAAPTAAEMLVPLVAAFGTARA